MGFMLYTNTTNTLMFMSSNLMSIDVGTIFFYSIILFTPFLTFIFKYNQSFSHF